MLLLILSAGLAALVAASPAPQTIDLAAVSAAMGVALSGPPLDATQQTGVYNPSSATATIIVTSVAAASDAATTTPPNKHRRDYPFSTSTSSSSATFCWGSNSQDICIAGSYDTASPPNFYPTTTILSTQTITKTTSSSTVCPTQPEAGVSCGFINPEDNCAPQPDGYGPHVEPDTTDAFYTYAPFHQAAQEAETPTGYANTFTDLNASSSANSYLGLYTLSSYDVTSCSQWCDNTTFCTAFNIYVERDPALNPSAPQCANTSSITNYKCTLWGSGLEACTATNTGGYRGIFPVVITGSNGYDKSNSTTPAPCSGWQPPQDCGGKAHNHPDTCMGSKFFAGPYNPQVCASFAAAHNAANEGNATVKCDFFNAYSLNEDDQPLGTYCLLYSEQYQPSQAAYVPGYISGHYYGIGSSWSYSSS